MDRFSILRKRMVEEQLIARGITDDLVLDAFLNVPREQFVPKGLQKYAYEDGPVSIGFGQTISQPYVVAVMTQLLDLKKDDKVLEIGTGSGYQTAILARLSGQVYTVERIPGLLERAKKILNELGYRNIYFRLGDGSLGWEDETPYDKIIVTAAAPNVPPSLIGQLKRSGKMVIPVGDRYSQDLLVVQKDEKNRIKIGSKMRCVFVPLVGEQGWKDEA